MAAVSDTHQPGCCMSIVATVTPLEELQRLVRELRERCEPMLQDDHGPHSTQSRFFRISKTIESARDCVTPPHNNALYH